MSATVQIVVTSPLGEVTVTQTGGKLRSVDYGPEIEQTYVVDALAQAIRRAAAAYGITPPLLGEALAAAIDREGTTE